MKTKTCEPGSSKLRIIGPSTRKTRTSEPSTMKTKTFGAKILQARTYRPNSLKRTVYEPKYLKTRTCDSSILAKMCWPCKSKTRTRKHSTLKMYKPTARKARTCEPSTLKIRTHEPVKQECMKSSNQTKQFWSQCTEKTVNPNINLQIRNLWFNIAKIILLVSFLDKQKKKN